MFNNINAAYVKLPDFYNKIKNDEMPKGVLDADKNSDSFDKTDVLGKDNSDKKGNFDKNECQTCKNRKYQDGSDDPGVSFKAPTKIDPGAAASEVLGHEREHVVREQAKASREDRKVISQSVVLKSAVCPECSAPYIAGGETRTVTKGTAQKKNPYEENMAKQNENNQIGNKLSLSA